VCERELSLSVLFDNIFALKNRREAEFFAEREQYSWRHEQKKSSKLLGSPTYPIVAITFKD